MPRQQNLKQFFKPVPPPGSKAKEASQAHEQPRPPPREDAPLGTSSEQPPATSARKDGTDAAPGDSQYESSAHGKVIPSSDGEETSDSSDSDRENDPLELLRKRAAAAPKTSSAPPTRSVTRAPAQAPKYTFDLKRLAADKERESKSLEGYQQAKELLTATQKIGDSAARNGSLDLTDEAARAITGEEDGTKLLQALDRSGAFKVTEDWEFFETAALPEPSRLPFPNPPPEGDCLVSAMQDGFARDEMFLSGYVKDAVLFGASLPDPVVEWMLDQLCMERRHDLAFAYQKVLGDLPVAQLRSILSAQRLERLFTNIGAKSAALDLEQELLPSSSREARPNPLRYNVELLIQFLGNNINYDDGDLTLRSVCWLIRLGLDRSISRQSPALLDAEHALGQILGNIPDDTWQTQVGAMISALSKTIVRPEFRARLLKIIPVYTSRLHMFRRLLALAFVREDSDHPSGESQDLQMEDIGHIFLKDEYKIHPKTNYAALKALVEIVDVAIDAGPASTPPLQKDRGIDTFIDLLQSKFSSIVDTNATNLDRTEAKEAMERLQARLMFVVRSSNKTAFDDRERQTKLPFLRQPKASESLG